MRSAILVVLVMVATGCRGPRAPRPTTGAIMGLVRDRASGDPIAMARLQVRRDGPVDGGAGTRSSEDGLSDLERPTPGRYTLTAHFAGEIVEVRAIDVSAGRALPVDVVFELGRGRPLILDYGNPADGAIDGYPLAAGRAGRIEGTVSDAATRERVIGAVVSADQGHGGEVRQIITDDQGRFLFDELADGRYTVSAYYTIAGRGHIEVQRNSLEVQAGRALVVPLWIELVGQ